MSGSDAGAAAHGADTAARRNAVMTVFGLAGFGIASWLSRIPTARADLGAQTIQMGVLALAVSIGSITGFTAAGRLPRMPPARAIRGSLAIAALGLVGAALGSDLLRSVAFAFVALLLLGFGAGVCNVVMNVQAAAVCRAQGRDTMPRFHAMFSIGGVVGAACGAAATALHLGLLPHLAASAGVVAVGAVLAVRPLLGQNGAMSNPIGVAPGEGRSRRSAWAEPRTLLVGLVALGMSFATGSANDWVALAMVSDRHVPAAIGSAAYGVFVVSMTTTRLLGHRLLARLGRASVIRVSAACTAIGIAVFVLGPGPGVAIVAVVLWGAGAALGFPVAMSSAAEDPSRSAARIGVVATIGYAASLSGPALIGFLGQLLGLSEALLPVVVFVAFAGLAAPALGRAERERPRPGRRQGDHRTRRKVV